MNEGTLSVNEYLIVIKSAPGSYDLTELCNIALRKLGNVTKLSKNSYMNKILNCDTLNRKST